MKDSRTPELNEILESLRPLVKFVRKSIRFALYATLCVTGFFICFLGLLAFAWSVGLKGHSKADELVLFAILLGVECIGVACFKLAIRLDRKPVEARPPDAGQESVNDVEERMSR